MSLVKSLLIGALFVIGSIVSAGFYGRGQYAAGHAAAILERAGADAKAVQARLRKNATTASHQAASNATITEKKHEEIQPVRERIVTRRVYVGSALCGDRPAAAETESAGGGDGADPPGRLVRPDVERDLVALKLQVEEDLATGRACQAVLKDEGIVP